MARDDHGHTYQQGHCYFCGRPDWMIDGVPQCDCEGRRKEEEEKAEEESNEEN